MFLLTLAVSIIGPALALVGLVCSGLNLLER